MKRARVSLVGVLALLGTLTLAAPAAANLTLDVRLTTPAGPNGKCSGPTTYSMGRVRVVGPNSAFVFQQPNTPLLVGPCGVDLAVHFTQDLLDHYLSEDLTIRVQDCGPNAQTCTFAPGTVVSQVVGPTPFDTVLDDVYSAVLDEVSVDINALHDAMDVETAARLAGDTALQNGASAEIAVRAAADTALQGGLSTEVAARIAADTALQAAVDTEVAARIAADALLQKRVTGVCPAGTAMLSINVDGTVVCVTVDTNPADDITAIAAGAGISVTGSGNARTITNTGDTNPADDVTSIAAGAGISVTGSGNSRTITNTGDADPSDDLTSLTAGVGIAIGGSGNSRTITNTGDAGPSDDLTTLNAGVGITITGSGNARTITNAGDLNPNDDVTSVSGAGGLTVSGSGNARTIGHATWSCPAGSSIRQIASDGTVACEVDDAGGAADNLGDHTATADLEMTNHSIVGIEHANGWAPDYVYYGANGSGSFGFTPYNDYGGYFAGSTAGVHGRTAEFWGAGVDGYNVNTGAYAKGAYGDRGMEVSGPSYGLVANAPNGLSIVATSESSMMDIYNENTNHWMKSVVYLYESCGGCSGWTGVVTEPNACNCDFWGCSDDVYACLVSY